MLYETKEGYVVKQLPLYAHLQIKKNTLPIPFKKKILKASVFNFLLRFLFISPPLDFFWFFFMLCFLSSSLFLFIYVYFDYFFCP